MYLDCLIVKGLSFLPIKPYIFCGNNITPYVTLCKLTKNGSLKDLI